MKGGKNIVVVRIKLSTRSERTNARRITVKNGRNLFTKLFQDVSYSQATLST